MPLRPFGSSGRGLRIMTSKKAMIFILASVSVILGLYLGFFNHPPATETLAMNLQLHEGGPDGGGTGVQRPRFRHLHFGHNVDPKSSAIRALNLSESETIAVDADLKQTTPALTRLNSNNLTAAVVNKLSPVKHIVGQKQESGSDHEVHKQEATKQSQPQKQQLGNAIQKGDITENAGEIGDITANAGEIEAESESGKNAGETPPREDVVEVKQDIDLVVDDDDDDDKNVGRSKEYGPHHIRIFDWDGWVKANNYIDVGTIWGYCDEPDPPPVGKVMMKKDEEWGSGVKIVIYMNSTFEESIEFGNIHLSVDVNKIHFFSKKYDACAMEAQSDFFHCPIQSGDKFFYIEQHIPIFLPMGEYYVESQLTDQFDRTIVCAQVKMTL